MGNRNGIPILRDEDVNLLSESSGVSEEEVRGYYEKFVKQHGGRLKERDFHKMIKLALPNKKVGDLEKHLFRFYDSNNDGFIDFVEFMLVYHILSDGSPEEILTRIFRVFDINSDGAITLKEMKRLVKDMAVLCGAKDSVKASDEMIATTAIAEMDGNGDGKVSLEEYIRACLENDQISKMLTMKIIEIFVDDE